jgi:hypothetical protein
MSCFSKSITLPQLWFPAIPFDHPSSVYFHRTFIVVSCFDRSQDRTSKPSLKLYLEREWVNWLVLQYNDCHFHQYCKLFYLFWILFYCQGCILDCAEMMDVVVKKGSWYSYGDHRLASELLFLVLGVDFSSVLLVYISIYLFGTLIPPPHHFVFMFSKRLGQGRDKALQYLRDNPHLQEEIEKVWLFMHFEQLKSISMVWSCLKWSSRIFCLSICHFQSRERKKWNKASLEVLGALFIIFHSLYSAIIGKIMVIFFLFFAFAESSIHYDWWNSKYGHSTSEEHASASSRWKCLRWYLMRM